MPFSDTDERELKVTVMLADLDLKRKQAIWGTPRNIAMLIAAVAAISGGPGFKIGQNSPPHTIVIQVPAAAR